MRQSTRAAPSGRPQSEEGLVQRAGLARHGSVQSADAPDIVRLHRFSSGSLTLVSYSAPAKRAPALTRH